MICPGSPGPSRGLEGEHCLFYPEDVFERKIRILNQSDHASMIFLLKGNYKENTSCSHMKARPAEVVQPLRPWSDQNLPFAVKILYLQNFGRTNNCVVEVFLKWSDQSRTPSTALGKSFKSAKE